MSKHHVMKTPDDLDIWTAEQEEATRLLDNHGEKARESLVFNVVAMGLAPAIMALTSVPMPTWQRAAYEAYYRAKADPDDKVLSAVARDLWATVRYLQATMDRSEEVMRYPKRDKFDFGGG